MRKLLLRLRYEVAVAIAWRAEKHTSEVGRCIKDKADKLQIRVACLFLATSQSTSTMSTGTNKFLSKVPHAQGDMKLHSLSRGGHTL